MAVAYYIPKSKLQKTASEVTATSDTVFEIESKTVVLME